MSNSNISNIGKRIAELRKSKGLTQDELATRLCITAQAISKWERGIGLPDITIFPALADALSVSVAVLFGEDTGAETCAPQTFENCSLVATFGDLLCYSNKTVSSVNDGKVIFSDGSIANFADRSVRNCGAGEIRIIESEAPSRSIDPKETTLERSFNKFESLNVSASFPCTTEILYSQDNFFGIKANGSALFISLIDSDISGDTLNVFIRSLNHGSHNESNQQNKILVFIPQSCNKSIKASIAGGSVIKSNTEFAKAAFKIAGSGTIQAQGCNEMTSSIAGSGTIFIKNASESSKIDIAGSGYVESKESLGENVSVKISGSGAVSAKKAANTAVNITGSGDVSFDEVAGDLSCSITGSGNMNCDGTVDNLKIRMNGSGELNGQGLTATEADIKILGNGSVDLLRIIKGSTENLSKHAKLKVAQRG